MKRITREEVSKQLVTDAYFEPGNHMVKIRQTIAVIAAWLFIFIPFLWLSIPVFFPTTADWLDFRIYFEERLAFWYLLIFTVRVLAAKQIVKTLDTML
ncbi:hypothetical protein A5886_000682 [Enterococcus sp. 8G7_MSG3316]|uniref:Uncharacterized protein n=1 Tax=Candidatus Enterococcus testudinis TaxID=1834191 RepID=A0A242A3I7_9ENTE|nr:hypothetical protein [Enterococcus sp. 8G7_MSG3316]OTN75607.1 hypothetical protein A5886_000682 [Enterococcus sp. 8G7_MSG3316]